MPFAGTNAGPAFAQTLTQTAPPTATLTDAPNAIPHHSYTTSGHNDTTITGVQFLSLTRAENVDAEHTLGTSRAGADSSAVSDAPARLDTQARIQILVLDPKIIQSPWFTGSKAPVNCESIGDTNVTIDLCSEEDAGDESSTSSILGASLVCTTPPTSYTSSSNLIAARNKVSLVPTAESESVDRLRITLAVTVG
jgi:hypothetical protein